MNTQSSRVRDLGVIFDQFLHFDDHITAICRTHIHIRNIDKIRNLLLYDACYTIIHVLISCQLDYCHSILYKGINYKDFRINAKLPRREHSTPVLTNLHCPKR